MKISFWHYLALISVVVLTMSSSVVVADGGKISGLYFGDYYYIAAHHNEELKSRNGFWTRRVYLRYDQKLNEIFSSRVRFEMANPDGLDSEADPKEKTIPFVKDAYLKCVSEGFTARNLLGTFDYADVRAAGALLGLSSG